MSLYAFSIDLDRCIGCQACTVACKAGNELENGDTYIKVRDVVTGQMPRLFGSFGHHRCFHCADAACVHVCPTGTLSKAANGMTVVDTSKCSGCGYCANACPYMIPTIAPNRRVSKCVACVDPVAEGGQPYCVQTCPSDAIAYGERDKILADAEARVAVLKARYPNAQVYGKTQLGGLGLLMILLDKPDVYGLLERPRIPSPVSVWQRMHPLTIPAAGLAAVLTGFAFVIGRRNHAREQAELYATMALEQAVPSTGGVVPAETPDVVTAEPAEAVEPVAAAPVAAAEVAAAEPAEATQVPAAAEPAEEAGAVAAAPEPVVQEDMEQETVDMSSAPETAGSSETAQEEQPAAPPVTTGADAQGDVAREGE